MYFKVGDIVDCRINNLSGTGEVYVLDKDYYKVRLDKNNVAYLYRWEMKLNITNRRKRIIDLI